MESVLSLLAKGFLTFSHGIVIAPLLLVGFLTRGGFFLRTPTREGSVVWGNACLLVLLSMVLNVLLKSIFLIPLAPELGIKGFAFPSGHMQVSVVLYGALLRAYPRPLLRGILLIILAGIGFGLIHQGYHTLTDVGGAIVFGIFTLYGFSKAALLSRVQKNPALLGLYLIPLTALMMGGIELRTGIPPHIAKTFMGLAGFSFFWLGLTLFVWKKGEG